MLLSKITCGVNFFQNLTLLKAFFGKSRNSIIYCIFIYKKNLLNPHMHRSDYREIVNSKVWKMWLNSSVIYWFTKRLFGPLGRPLITWRMTWLETDYRDRSEQRWSCSFITILVILVCLRNWNIVYDKSLDFPDESVTVYISVFSIIFSVQLLTLGFWQIRVDKIL